ncbi:HAUS augmin-like complex subunit 6 N-terminus-domain-containing protein [Amylocarpus encephaloides]|uniref:HAUS augmin-like complex subunit 6 N-terminus-domain-containing protein n=1 Tax=Amylocarpus encephaloides TaxID=45428 RepID=A0A9P8C9Y3_9HELO|nr:HAUS augmin-like complex subunit 6 N-terminus-domain-containing protein [Amylocarpus encephaloides]
MLPSTRSLRIPQFDSLKQPVTPATVGTSNVVLFVTNLRLLELDLRPDWPDISIKTFSTSQQNQKRRIQSVEWALYQLFALWDPEETQNKLQPFFPPLEPLQSLNLRAALFRCLDQAKKVGVLGRDTVLRKTMLDECKGERLEEVLAVFSNAVLKKVLRQNEGEVHSATSRQLAYENFSYSGERTVLSTLILAHKASLSKHLQQKDEARAKYNDFSELLQLNDRRLSRRHEQLKEALSERGRREEISSSEVRSLHDQTRKHWSGNEEWLETILYGDSKVGEGGILATRFSKVWEHVENGSIGEAESKSRVGLMEQLDARVKGQENRLARWKDFSKTLSEKSGTTASNSGEQPITERKKIDLGFTLHQKIQISSNKSAQSCQSPSPCLDEYNRLIEEMRSDIAQIRNPTPKTQSPRREAEPQSIVPEADEWSSVSDQEEAHLEMNQKIDVVELKIQSGVDKNLNGIANLEGNDASLGEENARENASLKEEKVVEEEEEEERKIASLEGSTASEDRARLLEKNLTRSESNVEEEDATLVAEEVDRALSPSPLPLALSSPVRQSSPQRQDSDDEAADQILNLMSEVSPSPKKPRHTLSLAERTRLSMSRTSHSQLSDIHDDFDIEDLPRLGIKSRSSLATRIQNNVDKNAHEIARPPHRPEDEETDLHAGLIERTRKSMAGFEAAQQKAQLARRRSMKEAKKKQRESTFFPKVEEEVFTPDISTVELIEGDPDYESVFKSRPKLAYD